ncbi:hypothetical protein [Methanopyrus sp.]
MALKNPAVHLLSALCLWGVAGLILAGAQSVLISFASMLSSDPGMILNAFVLLLALVSANSPATFAEIYMGEPQPYVIASILFGFAPIIPYLIISPFQCNVLMLTSWWKPIIMALLAIWCIEFIVYYRRVKTFGYRYVNVHRFVFR